jgi:hypothetical protein
MKLSKEMIKCIESIHSMDKNELYETYVSSPRILYQLDWQSLSKKNERFRSQII